MSRVIFNTNTRKFQPVTGRLAWGSRSKSEIAQANLCKEIRKFMRLKMRAAMEEKKQKRIVRKTEIAAEKAAKAQRKAARELKKQTEHKAGAEKPKRARKPNRPKAEIEAEKTAKAQRKAAREEKRLANALQFAKKALEAAKDNHSIKRTQESRSHLERIAIELSHLEEHHATISNGNARASTIASLT